MMNLYASELCDEHLGDSFTGKGGLTQWRAIGFKDGYSIAANTFKQLNSARYIGRFFPSENSVVNLYMRDGKAPLRWHGAQSLTKLMIIPLRVIT